MNLVAQQLYKAIEEKYGSKISRDVRDDWSSLKELEYREQLKELKKREELEKAEGLKKKRLFKKETKRICTSCNTYSFNREDSLYMNKFNVCFQCFVKHIEGREEKWHQNQEKSK